MTGLCCSTRMCASACVYGNRFCKFDEENGEVGYRRMGRSQMLVCKGLYEQERGH